MTSATFDEPDLMVSVGDKQLLNRADSLGSNTWTLLDENELIAGTTMGDAVAGLLASDPACTLDHDPVWLVLKARSQRNTVRAYVCKDTSGAVVGYAPFLVHPSEFAFSYAGKTFLRYPIRRYALTARPLFRQTNFNETELSRSLANGVRRDLSKRDVLFILGLHVQSRFGQAVEGEQLNADFSILPHGPEYQRRRARIEKSVDEYLGKLGSKTRQELRRQERKLLSFVGDEVDVEVYSTAESVDKFLEAVEGISRRTYQSNLLGITIKNDEPTRALLAGAAKEGWLRGYILRIKGVPAAFMIGYIYRKVYLSEHIGYDPEWASWSVGNVLHLHVMRDLCGLRDAVEWFDFMYGDNSNKQRLSTDAHEERNYYLIPKVLSFRILVVALKMFDRSTDALSRILDRYGLRERIRRAQRKRSVRAT